MIRRPRRSVPATAVALVLLAACILLALSVIQSLLDQRPLVSLTRLLSITSRLEWGSVGTVAAAIVIALLGLILLVVALRPGKPTVMPLVPLTGSDGSAMADAGVRRDSLVKDLAAVAAAEPGVARSEVRARRSSVTARITTAAADPVAVPGQVQASLEARLAEIGPSPMPRVRVRARRDKNT